MKSSPNREQEFVFGSFVYRYDLVRQDRKTLSLTVAPNLQISVKCPHVADDDRIEAFLRRKWFWLEKQLGFFSKYRRKTYRKEYVSGEGFMYLGKQYKLLVKKSGGDKVLMTKGLMMVNTSKGAQDGRHTKKLLDRWYAQRTGRVLHDLYHQVASRFGYRTMPRLEIREMRKRWGSFLNKDTIVLNPKLIHTPKDCIEYVVTHELCHMRYKNHDKNFYGFLKKQYPQWEKTKDKLETIGVQTS